MNFGSWVLLIIAIIIVIRIAKIVNNTKDYGNSYDRLNENKERFRVLLNELGITTDNLEHQYIRIEDVELRFGHLLSIATHNNDSRQISKLNTGIADIRQTYKSIKEGEELLDIIIDRIAGLSFGLLASKRSH